MNVKGIGQCELRQTEIKTLESAYAIVDQLAWHWRETERGKDSEKTAFFLKWLLADKKLCPAKEAEAAASTPADTKPAEKATT